MVFFTCNACGESLKKAQIQKHTSMCRGCQVLSCIDCGKDFWGEDYKTHVKCISEDQKYGGKNYEAKANKGDVKQQQWMQKVQMTLDKPGVSARLRSVLQQVVAYDNVPRKKAKFQNWIKNSLKIYDSSLQEQVWEIFSSSDIPADKAEQPKKVSHTPPAPAVQEEQAKPEEKKKNKRERKEERQKKGKTRRMEDEQKGQNGVEEPQKNKKRKRGQNTDECGEDGEGVEEKTTEKMKKRKKPECEESTSVEEEENGQEEQEESTPKGTFNWKGTIKAVLRDAPDEGIALKKLRKKVFSAYYSFSGEDNYKSEEELHSLFNKKLKNPKFKILKEKVRLVK